MTIGAHVLALLTGGAPVVWGSYDQGHTGADPAGMMHVTAPTLLTLSPGGRIDEIAAGGRHIRDTAGRRIRARFTA